MQDNDDDQNEAQLSEFVFNLGVFLFKIMIWVVAFLWLASFLQK